MYRLTPLILIVPVFAWAQAALEPSRTSPDIASFEAGIICPPESVGTSPAPGTLAGETHIIDVDPPFVSTARRVPAVMGIGFGVKAMAADEFGMEDVVMVVTHPPMGDAQVQTQSYVTSISGVAPSLTFYQFDFAYELVTGPWQMVATRDGEVLYQTSFEVVPPQLVPELASVCGFENLLS